MTKKKLTYTQRRQQQNQVNKKALYIIGSILGAFIILMSILIIFNK